MGTRMGTRMGMRGRIAAASAALLLIASAPQARAGEGMPQLDFGNPLTSAQVVATREAHAGAQAEIAQAVAVAKEAADKEAAVLNARLDAQIAEAEQRIAQARVSAMGALAQVATDTANEVVRRLTGTAINDTAVNQAVAAVLAARAQ